MRSSSSSSSSSEEALSVKIGHHATTASPRDRALVNAAAFIRALATGMIGVLLGTWLHFREQRPAVVGELRRRVVALVRRQPARFVAIEKIRFGQQLEGVHIDRTRLELDGFATARLGVQGLTATLERRIDRWPLHDAPSEIAQRGVDGVDVIA